VSLGATDFVAERGGEGIEKVRAPTGGDGGRQGRRSSAPSPARKVAPLTYRAAAERLKNQQE
jgi:hypothetical protein